MLHFFIKDFNLSQGFYTKSGLIIGHSGSLFILIFMWPFSLCVVPWVICIMFEVGVGVGLFFLVISICTVLLCFGRGIGIACSLINCFWNI